MKIINSSLFNLLIWTIVCHVIKAQDTVSLEQLNEMAIQQFPLTRQRVLVDENLAIQKSIFQSSYLPQANISAQAGWQSEVTELPIKIPGVPINTLAKDQYRIQMEVTQLLYDGGLVKNQKKISTLNSTTELQKISVEQYKIKEKILQLVVQIHTLDALNNQTVLLQEDLRQAINKAEVQVNQGVAFKSALYSLQAEYIRTLQKQTEIISARSSLYNTLSLLSGKSITDQTKIVLPKPDEVNFSKSNQRLELSLFDSQIAAVRQQDKLNKVRIMPRLTAFAQGGYGRPGLNFLNNEFDPFFIGGIKAFWNPTAVYNLKKERQIIQIHKSMLELQKDNFLLNNSIQLSQSESELLRYKELIKADEELIVLRRKIKTSAAAQLDQGVITSADYIRELNAEDQAKQSLIIHQLQYLQSLIQYKYILGQ